MKKFITVIGIASIAHAINRSYCQSQGDETVVAWDQTSEGLKNSVINGVEFHLANPDAAPSASHENWLKFKEANGWKYGPVNDEAKKEHPCMVPFIELPASQQAKDYIFKQTVHELAPYIIDGADELEPKEAISNVDAPAFKTNLKVGDSVMVSTGGPKMKVDVVFDTQMGVKAHCTWTVAGQLTSDVFFERNLHKFEKEAPKEETAQANPPVKEDAALNLDGGALPKNPDAKA